MPSADGEQASAALNCRLSVNGIQNDSPAGLFGIFYEGSRARSFAVPFLPTNVDDVSTSFSGNFPAIAICLDHEITFRSIPHHSQQDPSEATMSIDCRRTAASSSAPRNKIIAARTRQTLGGEPHSTISLFAVPTRYRRSARSSASLAGIPMGMAEVLALEPEPAAQGF